MLTVTTGIAGPRPLVVFMLHGHGMRAGDFAPFARSLGVAGIYHFPEGPLDLTDGTHAWWHKVPRESSYADVARMAFAHPPGRVDARRKLASHLLSPELVPADATVVLAGFSQGGMLACETVLLQDDVRVDALALFSSSRVAFDEWRPALTRLAGLPVLVAHGLGDDELPFAAGEALRDCLVDGGAQVQWLPFDGGHQVPLVVWRQFRRLLREVAHADA